MSVLEIRIIDRGPSTPNSAGTVHVAIPSLFPVHAGEESALSPPSLWALRESKTTLGSEIRNAIRVTASPGRTRSFGGMSARF